MADDNLLVFVFQTLVGFFTNKYSSYRNPRDMLFKKRGYEELIALHFFEFTLHQRKERNKWNISNRCIPM